MVERQMSVRLVSTGGQQVKAELMSVGTAGQQAFGQIERSSGQMGGGLQNAALQVGDFAVQVGAGTSATQALAQQLPQLLGGFGLFGALAGAAAAIMLPLGRSLFGAGEAAKSLDGAFGELDKSLSSYQKYIEMAAKSTAELAEEFGGFAGQIKAFSEFMAGVQLGQAFDDLRATIDPLKGDLADVQGRFRAVVAARETLARNESSAMATSEQLLLFREAVDLYQAELDAAAEKLGLTSDQALKLAGVMDDLGRAKTMSEMAAAAGDVLAVMREIAPTGAELPAKLRAAAAELEKTQREAASAAESINQLPGLLDSAAIAAATAASAVGGIGIAADGAFGAVSALAGKMWDIAAARQAADDKLGQMAIEFSPGGRALTKFGTRGAPTSAQTALASDYDLFGARIDPATTRRPGGGGLSAAAKEEQDALREVERLFESTRTEAEKFAAEQTRINDLFKAGYIDAELQARGIAALEEKYGSVSGAAGLFGDMTDDLKSSILDMAADGVNSFDDLAKSIKRAALEMLLFGEGPFAGMFGGAGGGAFKGILGGLLNFDGGGWTGDGPRSGGLDGKGGYLAMIHPREIIRDTTKGGATTPAAPVQVVVSAAPSDYFDLRVAQVSGAGDARTARAQQQAMPSAMRDMRARGTR